MGILPAEEVALNKALKASLIQDSAKSHSTASPAKKFKLEPALEEPITHLSSPDLSDDDSQNLNFASHPVSSCPSSPLSYQSTNSLHLCLSSSSWSTSSQASSCDSLFSPWSPGTKKASKKQPVHSNTREVGTTASKRLLEFDGNIVGGSSGGDAKLEGTKGTFERVQTARKSAIRVESNDDLKEAPFQVQRKFASNHVPLPVR